LEKQQGVCVCVCVCVPPFCDGYFPDRVSPIVCQGWLRTTILLISASLVARITGVSHQCCAPFFLCECILGFQPVFLQRILEIFEVFFFFNDAFTDICLCITFFFFFFGSTGI
jgi:hypothetical protein